MQTSGINVLLREGLPLIPKTDAVVIDREPLLDRVGVTAYSWTETPTQATLQATLSLNDELVVAVPGLAGMSFVFGGPGYTGSFAFELDRDPIALRIPAIDSRIRVSADVACAVELRDGRWEVLRDAAGLPRPLEISLTGVAFAVDANANIAVTLPGGATGVSVPPFMIASSGVVVEPDQLATLWFSLAQTPAGKPAGWRGVLLPHAPVHLPETELSPRPAGLVMQGCALTGGGFEGAVDVSWAPGVGAGRIHGLAAGVTRVHLDFFQSAAATAAVDATLTLPFFDRAVAVTLGLSGDGGYTVGLAASQPAGVTYASGVATFELPGIVRVALEGLRLEADAAGPVTRMAAEMTPLLDGLRWPTLRVPALAVDAAGEPRLDGGWLPLAGVHHLDFHGFDVELSRIAFGRSRDGQRWMGFRGGVHLLDGTPAGDAPRGLRASWRDGEPPRMALDDVPVAVEIADALSIAGAVSYRSVVEGGTTVHRLEGSGTLRLVALGATLDASITIGRDPATPRPSPYMTVQLAAEPAGGIPIWSSGLSLYGIEGALAIGRAPARAASELWYDSWYVRAPAGAADLAAKWTASAATTFVAGVTLGTFADGGDAYSGRMALAIALPGPVLLLDGRARLVGERAALGTASLRTTALLDGRVGALRLGLDGWLRQGAAGELLDLRASASAAFEFHDAAAWSAGLASAAAPVRAKLLGAFRADTRVALGARALALTAYGGDRRRVRAGAADVAVDAWLDANAALAAEPAQLHATVGLLGRAELNAYGQRLVIGFATALSADAPSPRRLSGDLSLGVALPWPLPSPSAVLPLEWESDPRPPALPVPVKEVAIDHPKATASWPLPRGTLLLPSYDSDADGRLDGPTGADAPADPASVGVVVPLDARPHVTFGRPVNDDAKVGVNAQPAVPEWERMGDPVADVGPGRVRYGLDEMALERWVPSSATWETTARKATTANPPGVDTLYGAWATAPELPDRGGRHPAQTSLWLWARSPFVHRRHASRAWDEWFASRFDRYPCGPDVADVWDVDDIAPGTLPDPWTHPAHLVLRAPHGRFTVEPVDSANPDGAHALRVSTLAGASLELPSAVSVVEIDTDRTYPAQAIAGYDAAGNRFPSTPRSTPVPFHEVRGTGIVRIAFEGAATAGPTALAAGFTGAAGCTYIGARGQLLVAEAGDVAGSGKITAVDPATGARTVLGGGYTLLRDVAVTSDGATAYLVEAGGAFLKVSLGAAPADRANATQLATVASPAAIALDPAGIAYVIERASPGRVVAIELVGRTGPSGAIPVGTVTPIVSDVANGAGIALAPAGGVLYVSEEGDAVAGVPPRLRRVTVADGVAQLVATAVVPTRLAWADAHGARLLTIDRAGSPAVVLVDPAVTPAMATSIAAVPAAAASVALLPGDRLAVCGGTDVSVAELALRAIEVRAVRAEGMLQHLRSEVARFGAEGHVLQPDTAYRLKIITTARGADFGRSSDDVERRMTEYAYFRTAGPQGTSAPSTPIGHPAAVPFRSGAEDLARYVRATVPPAHAGEAAATPVPAYRAYDVSVSFDEDHVATMYRSAQRDLALHVHDGNGPVRDEAGRLVIPATSWTRAARTSALEEGWATLLRDVRAMRAATQPMIGTQSLAPAGERHLLAARTPHEVRVQPTLLKDDFTSYAVGTTASGPSGALGPWRVHDAAGSAASRWTVQVDGAARAVAQSVTATSALVFEDGSAAAWTDHRVRVRVVPASTAAAGLVFRYRDASNHYRFWLEGGTAAKLVRHLAGVAGAVQTAAATYDPAAEHVLMVEALGASVRAYVDGALVFEVSDATLVDGRAGLYVGGSASARFRAAIVEDFRSDAPSAFRFGFTTSAYANFFHHLHAFEDETWRADLAGTVDLAPTLAASVPSATTAPPAEPESAAAAALAALVPAAGAGAEVQVTRLERAGAPVAFRLDSREPLALDRMSLSLSRASRKDLLQRAAPGPVKMTDVGFGTAAANEEAITLLLREDTDLDGHRIEYRRWLLFDAFDGLVPGRWSFVDETSTGAPSAWSTADGALLQTSAIGGTVSSVPAARPGTIAVAGDPGWTDTLMTVHLSSSSAGAIGVVFRYQDASSYYRFALDAEAGLFRLVKRVSGTFTLLWEGPAAIVAGREYAVEVACTGPDISVRVDGEPVVETRDDAVDSGSVGLYSWSNPGARFSELTVAAPGWSTFYAFGSEATLAAGTRVRIHAGNSTDPVPEDDAVVRRFVATGTDHGTRKLLAEGADLRIATPTGPGHVRRFLPPGAFSPVEARVVRLADASGLFVLAPLGSDSSLPEGTYRLELVYRRDNCAYDKDSPVHTEAGDARPEIVRLDVPWSTRLPA